MKRPRPAREPARKRAVEMTVRGKPGKPTPGFPLFPPPLEIAARFPHSHRFDDCFLYKGAAKTAWLQNQQLRVGQIKPPKRANCGLAKRAPAPASASLRIRV